MHVCAKHIIVFLENIWLWSKMQIYSIQYFNITYVFQWNLRDGPQDNYPLYLPWLPHLILTAIGIMNLKCMINMMMWLRNTMKNYNVVIYTYCYASKKNIIIKQMLYWIVDKGLNLYHIVNISHPSLVFCLWPFVVVGVHYQLL